MNLVTHITTTSLITLAVLGESSFDKEEILTGSILINSLIDIDHIIPVLKNPKFFTKNKTKQVWHEARTIFHELLGVSIFASIALVVSFFSTDLAKFIGIILITHLTEDFIFGTSYPFKPFNKTPMHLFKLTMKQKFVIEQTINLILTLTWLILLID